MDSSARPRPAPGELSVLLGQLGSRLGTASEPTSPNLRSVSRGLSQRWAAIPRDTAFTPPAVVSQASLRFEAEFPSAINGERGACVSEPSSLLHATPALQEAVDSPSNTWTDSEVASCLKAGPLSDTCVQLSLDHASLDPPPSIPHARSATELEITKIASEIVSGSAAPRNSFSKGRSLTGAQSHSSKHPKMFQTFQSVTAKNALAKGTVAPGQPFPAKRVKDKVVPLGLTQDTNSATDSLEDEAEEECTAFCVAYELDLKTLERSLIERFGPAAVFRYPEDSKDGTPAGTPDIIFAKFCDDYGRTAGDVMYFEFGVVVAWNLTVGQEFDAVFQVAMAHATQPLPEADVEVDEFKMQYSVNKPPQVQNDTIVLANRYIKDQLMKLSVSLALAQSTRISVQEKQVIDIVMETRDLPIELARSGKVRMSSEKLAQAIGSVFLQKSALNLQVLTGSGETPKFFYGRADYLALAYKTVSEYLEMDGRIEVLNSRFQVLTDMLTLLRDQQCVSHEQHLEWIVISLIVITIALGVFQIASLLGVISIKHGPVTPGKLLAYVVQTLVGFGDDRKANLYS